MIPLKILFGVTVFGFLLLAFFLSAFLSSRFGDVLSRTFRRAKKRARHKKDSGKAQTQKVKRRPHGGRGDQHERCVRISTLHGKTTTGGRRLRKILPKSGSLGEGQFSRRHACVSHCGGEDRAVVEVPRY